MGTAVLNPATRPQPPLDPEPASPPAAAAEALRQQAAARIAAHRHRRERLPQPGSQTPPSPAVAADLGPDPQKARIAATVAHRYAQAQSYRAFLAAEAERATQQARAAAEIAARNAQAIADAQQQLLSSFALHTAAGSHPANPEPSAATATAGLAQAALHPADAPHSASAHPYRESHPDAAAAAPSLWPELDPLPEPAAPRSASAHPRSRAAGSGSLPESLPGPLPQPAPALRVLLYDAIPSRPPALHTETTRSSPQFDPWDPEASLLDQEISFRQAPVFEEPAGPPVALPANLIEFPRQLVASRRARPRYAEGPLREEHPTPAPGSQLRIFEVDPAQIATAPDPFWNAPWDPEPSAHRRGSLTAATLAAPASDREPQWTALWLDTPAFAAAAPLTSADGLACPALPTAATVPQLCPAAWSRRALAAAVDGSLIGAATLCFAAAFAAITGHAALTDPASPAALLAASPSFFDPSTFFSAAAWSPGALLTGAAAALHDLPVLTVLGALAGTGAALAFAYQALWFTFSDATPGMRFARIGLCTFSDDNPTRAAMRRRVPALALSTLLFGIGFLWALLDEDGLPWHDLISRMYPRSY